MFETCAPDLKVNGTLQATYKVGREKSQEDFFSDFFQSSSFQGVLWTVGGNPVTAQSLAGVQIK